MADYLALGTRQSLLNTAQREVAHGLFQRYRAWLDEAGLYDSNLVAHTWRTQIAAAADPPYDFVVIDEVQDLTPVQLALVLALLKKPGQFILCGDSHQIVHPNFFSWSALKSLFWQGLAGDAAERTIGQPLQVLQAIHPRGMGAGSPQAAAAGQGGTGPGHSRCLSAAQARTVTYTVAEHMQEDHDNAATGLEGFEAEDLQRDLPPAHVFIGTAEEAVARYTGLVRAHAGRRRAVGHHSVVQRLLAEDERRASEASPYAWQQPLYRGRQGQTILQAVDKIAWHWTNAGLRVAASGGHTIELSVSGAGQSSGFELRATPAPKREGQRGRPPSRTTLEFWLDPDRDARRKADKPALVFNTMDTATVDTLTSLVITSWERRVREWFRWRHHHIVESRGRAVRAIEEAERRERERREAEVRALHNRRQRLLLRAIDRARRAQEIRAFVAEMESGPSSLLANAAALAQWKVWALAQADFMDLRVQPSQGVDEWLGEFGFGGDTVS